MKKAWEKRPGGRLVSADEIGPVPEPFRRPLICEFCDSAVGPVRGYKNVPNLFRLLKGTLHQPGCALNPTEFIQGIARGSHGLAHVTDQGLLRLELPEHIDAMPPFTAPDDETGPDGPVRKRDTTTVRPYLPPAITSAAKIARFLQMHGFDPKTVDRFRVKPHTCGCPCPGGCLRARWLRRDLSARREGVRGHSVDQLSVLLSGRSAMLCR
ncbi:hypothetical protein [Streptomyces sp. NPDC058092]|uniref:hypothetical protein n=1 Tax=Streptomyces sp. NPDC058092 TaxID=3346336 RepID=UPI0036E589ED